MKSTFTPSPGWRSRAWRRRKAEDVHANVQTAYYAGWFLDHATGGPKDVKEGREEQQFPDDVVSAALRWYHDISGLDAQYRAIGWGTDPYVSSTPEVVFAYGHYSRFEDAPRVWPPLVPFTALAGGEGYRDLTYTRDYDAGGIHPRRHRGEVPIGTYRGCCGVTEPHIHYRIPV